MPGLLPNMVLSYLIYVSQLPPLVFPQAHWNCRVFLPIQSWLVITEMCPQGLREHLTSLMQFTGGQIRGMNTHTHILDTAYLRWFIGQATSLESEFAFDWLIELVRLRVYWPVKRITKNLPPGFLWQERCAQQLKPASPASRTWTIRAFVNGYTAHASIPLPRGFPTWFPARLVSLLGGPRWAGPSVPARWS